MSGSVNIFNGDMIGDYEGILGYIYSDINNSGKCFMISSVMTFYYFCVK